MINFGLQENISFSYLASLGPTAKISGDNETLFVADCPAPSRCFEGYEAKDLVLCLVYI